MTNYEKNKEKIDKYLFSDSFEDTFGVKTTGEICSCEEMCDYYQCVFDMEPGGCVKAKIKWLVSEYKEKIKITPEERYYLKYILELLGDEAIFMRPTYNNSSVVGFYKDANCIDFDCSNHFIANLGYFTDDCGYVIISCHNTNFEKKYKRAFLSPLLPENRYIKISEYLAAN